LDNKFRDWPETTNKKIVTMSKRVLILGGTGFIGRHILRELIDNKIASHIRIADKRPYQTAYCGEYEKYYTDKLVEYKQSNLSNQQHVTKAFTSDGGKYDWVINLAAETRYGQEENAYKQFVLDLSLLCAQEAEKMGVEKYIEFSTGHGLYTSGKKGATEKDTPKPWTLLGKYKLMAEEEIKKKCPKLPLIIVRPAIVYGPGDINGLMPRIICGATYTQTKEKMDLLWTSEMRINTVHVYDVAKATILLLEKGQAGTTWNLCDKNDTNQGKINAILEEIFGIKTGFMGSIISSLAQLKLDYAAKTANENHMGPWSDMTQTAGIKFTPLSPFLDKELLTNNPVFIDGSGIESIGFKYEHPELNKALIDESIKYFVDQQLFPKVEKLTK
jgi:nucleoside-diphosphate-sugar epimerase